MFTVDDEPGRVTGVSWPETCEEEALDDMVAFEGEDVLVNIEGV